MMGVEVFSSVAMGPPSVGLHSGQSHLLPQLSLQRLMPSEPHPPPRRGRDPAAAD